MKLFGRKRDTEQPQAEIYTDLRRQALGLTVDQLGDAATAETTILALLMETGYPEAVATLVAAADGSSSLYFSNGGGIIGAGTHPEVAGANRRFLEVGSAFLSNLSMTTDPPLPAKGSTQLVAVTPTGLYAAVVPEAELGKGEHPLSPLFYAGQDLITHIRLVEGG